MMSSTRSRESASRSSWNDASAVISDSSMPSCSVKTSFTRSKTSSRDAAITPHSYSKGPKARRSYTGSGAGPGPTALALRHVALEPPHDVVLDAPCGESDRVRNGAPGRVAVGDNDDSAHPEEIGAAVRLR